LELVDNPASAFNHTILFAEIPPGDWAPAEKENKHANMGYKKDLMLQVWYLTRYAI
jgi:hypothetical protein